MKENRNAIYVTLVITTVSTIWNQDSDTWQGGGSLRKLYRLIRART